MGILTLDQALAKATKRNNKRILAELAKIKYDHEITETSKRLYREWKRSTAKRMRRTVVIGGKKIPVYLYAREKGKWMEGTFVRSKNIVLLSSPRDKSRRSVISMMVHEFRHVQQEEVLNRYPSDTFLLECPFEIDADAAALLTDTFNEKDCRKWFSDKDLLGYRTNLKDADEFYRLMQAQSKAIAP